jgi:hypothetical protein
VAVKTSVMVFCFMMPCNPIGQCGPTGGPWATSGQRPLVTRPMKLFVHLLLVAVS